MSVERFGTEFAGVWSDIILHLIGKTNEWGLKYSRINSIELLTLCYVSLARNY